MPRAEREGRKGGGETHARLLCRELNERGVPVFVVTRVRKKGLKKFEQIDGVDVHRVWPAGFDRWGKYLLIVSGFVKLCSLRREYDLVYICGLRVLGIVGILAGVFLGKKCILRAESCGELSGEFIWDKPGEDRHRLLHFMAKPFVKVRNAILRRADHFLSISKVIHAEFVQEKVACDRTSLIPNGIETDRFCPVSGARKEELRNSFNIPDRLVFTYTGKLNRGKGLEVLLRSFKRLAKKHSRAHLLLVGGGGFQFLSCENELREYVRGNGMEEAVTFTGYTDDVLGYLQCSDFFVFPSESEALGISLIEAMSCGLPSIGTRIGGIVDLIDDGETGLLVSVDDENGIFESMEYMMTHPDEAGIMGRKGRETIRDSHDIKQIAQQHIDLFARVSAAQEPRIIS